MSGANISAVISTPLRFLMRASGELSCGQLKKQGGVAAERSTGRKVQTCAYGMPKLIGTSSRKLCMVSITNASTPVSANFLGKCFDAAVKRPANPSRMLQRITSRPCMFDTGAQSLTMEPAGKGRHRIQVTDNGQTYKTNFHGNS